MPMMSIDICLFERIILATCFVLMQRKFRQKWQICSFAESVGPPVILENLELCSLLTKKFLGAGWQKNNEKRLIRVAKRHLCENHTQLYTQFAKCAVKS